MLAAVCAQWVTTRRAAAVAFANVQEGGNPPHNPPHGGGEANPPRCWYVHRAQRLAGAELPLGTGTRAAPSQPVPSDDFFLSPSFVQAQSKELADDSSGRSCTARWRPWVRSSTGWERPSLISRTRRGVGRFWYVVVLCHGRARRRGSASPPAAGCARRCFASAIMALRAGAPRRCSASATTARSALRASQDGVAGAAPRLLGGPGRRRR